MNPVLKSLLMRGLRGLVAAALGSVVAFLTGNLAEIVSVLGVPVSVAGVITAAVAAGLLVLDKWVRDFQGK
ncbi:hypothetical protein [Neomegalonema sp.]|uniref:hypothetical protein n=1 Tax=Neomegalonema sp. TaxID=2039713 RepID=UPI0026335DA8|nr:hypothetical protein [Neomegalonema sp.]MDD2869649.1 hypothetical protein [Neomegalonema sp.]